MSVLNAHSTADPPLPQGDILVFMHISVHLTHSHHHRTKEANPLNHAFFYITGHMTEPCGHKQCKPIKNSDGPVCNAHEAPFIFFQTTHTKHQLHVVHTNKQWKWRHEKKRDLFLFIYISLVIRQPPVIHEN